MRFLTLSGTFFYCSDALSDGSAFRKVPGALGTASHPHSMLARLRSGLLRRLEAFTSASSDSGNDEDEEEEAERLRDSDTSEDDDADLEDNVDEEIENDEASSSREGDENDQKSNDDQPDPELEALEAEDDDDSSVGFVPPNTTSNSCDDVREGLSSTSPMPLEAPEGEASSSAGSTAGSIKKAPPRLGRHRRKRHLRRLADLLAARYPALLLDMHEEVMLEHARARRERLLACLAAEAPLFSSSSGDGSVSPEPKEAEPQMAPDKAERLCQWVVREYHRVKRISANQSAFLSALVSF